jgi:putative membrane protein
MDTVAQVCTGITAVILIAVFPFEAVLIDRPWVQQFLGIEPHGIANVHLWSFCIGVRNALAGIGALVGLWILRTGDEPTGVTVVVVALAYMLLSSLAMGVADLLGFWRPRGGSVRGTIASSVLPAVALLVIAA